MNRNWLQACALCALTLSVAFVARAQSPASNEDPAWMHQAKDHWYDERMMSGQAAPSLVFGLDPAAQGSFGINSLWEMQRLFGSGDEPGDIDLPGLERKALLSLPLLRRGNGIELLFRPKGDIYNTYLKRLSVESLNSDPRVDPPAGALALDLHVHTCYSHDSLADPAQMLRAAAHRGLSGLAITDHNTMDGARKALAILPGLIRRGEVPAGFMVIPGEEISSTQGHIIGLFLTHELPPDMSAERTVEEIHAQGGLAIAAHPLLPDGVGARANTLGFDAVESDNAAEEMHFALAGHPEAGRDAFYRAVRRPHVGASDAHDPAVVAACYTLLPDCAPTEAAVRESIASGRTQPMTRFDDTSERRTLRHGLPRAFFLLGSVFGSDTEGLSGWLRDHTHADSARVMLLPHPSVYWAKRF